MNIHRIKISVLHTWYHFLHSMETWVDLFWNSILQMIVFSFIAVVFSRGEDSLLGVYMLTGMVLWNVIWAGQYGLTVGVMWEVWSHSLTSLFITPLTLEEFLIGQAVSSTIKAAISVILTALVTYVIFGFSVLTLGWPLLLYAIELLVFGWAAGMIVLSLIFRMGTDVQSLSWSIVFLIQPFGAVFYPVQVLPEQIRWIAFGIPTTYIFETVRGQLRDGSINGAYLAIGTVLNVIYLVGAYFILQRTYAASRKSGAFARLEG
ncbi:MAG: ABC transporter permease [bacterium]|nr:ABC transporter permease [bacterium]